MMTAGRLPPEMRPALSRADVFAQQAHKGGVSSQAWDLVLWVLLGMLALGLARTLAIRGVDLGPDIRNYWLFYETVGDCACLAPNPAVTWDIGWAGLALFGNEVGLVFTDWLTLVILLQSILWMFFGYGAARLLEMSRESALLVVPLTLLLVQVYPFLHAGQANILRSGLATPLGALATLAVAKGMHGPAGLLAVAALSLHLQVGLILCVGLFGFAFVRRAWGIGVFAVLSVGYMAGVSPTIGGALIPEPILSIALGYGAEAAYITGVRLDFLAFTVIQFGVVLALAWRYQESAYGGRIVSWLVGLAFPFLLVGGVGAYADRWLQPYWSVAAVIIALLVFRSISIAQPVVALWAFVLSVVILLLGFT